MDHSMKKFITAGFFGLIFMTGCHQAVINSEKTTPSAIPVTVTTLRTGRMSSYLELSATSEFLFKAVVKAPVTGYIDNMFISQGDAVENNRLLFTVKTKEASAINNDSLKNIFTGIVDIKAAVAGLISSIEHPKGDYVSEGDQYAR
jgi:multidrug efflux pump subunit AcrA (membrane-fusion protein)